MYYVSLVPLIILMIPSLTIGKEDFNITLLDLKIGDISYETLFEDGELAITETIKFYDGDDNMYEKIPLQTIDSSVHKISEIDHDFIKDNIESLLEEYSETDNDKLKNIMNVIYSALELHYEKYDIIPRLNNIRKSFVDKTPIGLTGKLYKRFSKRLFSINKKVMNGAELYKRLNSNSKIIDLREESGSTDINTSYDSNRPDNEYLYEDWKYFDSYGDLESEDVAAVVRIVAGYLFFDYEKACRTKSSIGRTLNVNALERYGIDISYEYYKITSIEVVKSGLTSEEDRTMTIDYDSSDYPYASEIDYGSDYTSDPSGEASLLANTVYGGVTEEDTTIANGFYTRLINRAYVGWKEDDVSEIDDYRLMCLELLEYMIITNTEGQPAYEITINISDTTNKIVVKLYNLAKEALESLQQYVFLATEDLAYNNDFDQFNKYFAENIIKEYESEPSSAPWVLAPIVYAMQTDIFYDRYDGNAASVEQKAKEYSNQINPLNGTLESLLQFQSNFENFFSRVYKEVILQEQVYNMFGGLDFEEDISPQQISFTSDFDGPIEWPIAIPL